MLKLLHCIHSTAHLALPACSEEIAYVSAEMVEVNHDEKVFQAQSVCLGPICQKKKKPERQNRSGFIITDLFHNIILDQLLKKLTD